MAETTSRKMIGVRLAPDHLSTRRLVVGVRCQAGPSLLLDRKRLQTRDGSQNRDGSRAGSELFDHADRLGFGRNLPLDQDRLLADLAAVRALFAAEAAKLLQGAKERRILVAIVAAGARVNDFGLVLALGDADLCV